MKHDPGNVQGLIRRNVRRAAGNIVKGPAMTIDEAKKAVELGMEMADMAYSNGAAMIATGEMGIGNTTPSAALFAALLPSDVASVTGTGTGIDEEGLKNKIRVIEKSLEINRSDLDKPLSALAAVGGFEIAGICGLCLGGAARRMVVVVDGFISSAGALVAMRLNPMVRDYLFFSHQSVEKGHRKFFEKEGIRPLLNLDMRLGEGTGAGKEAADLLLVTAAVLLITTVAIQVSRHRAAAATAPIKASLNDYSEALDLGSVTTIGTTLYARATAWDKIGDPQRQLAAVRRLGRLASAKGYTAVFLVDEDGEGVARWSVTHGAKLLERAGPAAPNRERSGSGFGR